MYAHSSVYRLRVCGNVHEAQVWGLALQLNLIVAVRSVLNMSATSPNVSPGPSVV